MASLWAILKHQAELKEASVPTRKQFGEIMHDPNAPEWLKQKTLRKLEEAGGYENLPS